MPRFAVIALLVTVILTVLLLPLASSSPDGLERVATDHGFAGHAHERGALADYELGGGAVPGVIGVFVVGWAAAAVLRRRWTT